MKKSIIFFLILLFLAANSFAEIPGIDVVYPKPDGIIGAVDSTFIFGNVTEGSELTINGYPVDVHRDGGFLAYLPLDPGRFVFRLIAVKDGEITAKFLTVLVPYPLKSPPYDSLTIEDKSQVMGNLSLIEGDVLTLSILGTPGCHAYFSIPGYVDSVPMVEMPPQVQPYWGEAVFGVGAVPDSLKMRGYYMGFLKIDSRKPRDSTQIVYHLRAPLFNEMVGYIVENPIEAIDFDALKLMKIIGDEKVDSSSFYVQINPDNFPRILEFTDSVQTMRVGPRKGYLTIFQPAGVKAMAVGEEGDWIRLALSETQIGWVDRNSVKFLNIERPPIKSHIRAIRIDCEENAVIFELPLKERHPFKIEETDARTISISVFGANSDTDWIRYEFEDDFVGKASWSQVEPDFYRLDIDLSSPVWGFDTYYEGTVLKLRINKPPQDVDNIRDKTIVVDAGHSPDPGAVGPTRLLESEANLMIAWALKDELQKRGAQVIMTRNDMSPLPLYDRPEIAKKYDADLFVSIHNNALPDGVNPFENNGSSTYYYHDHSIELAKAIQKELIDEIDLGNHGLYYGNLAVNRPTQYPAVLVECAFMILPEQEAMLKKYSFQKKIARAIRKGIERFLDGYQRKIEQ